MLRLVQSVFKSVLTAIRHDPEVERLLAAHPEAWSFISRRFSREDPLGLRLTIGAATSIIFLYLFFAIVEDLIFKDPLVKSDLRIMSLFQIFRTPSFNDVMLFITYLGNWQIVVAGVILFGVYLILSRRWLWLALLIISVVGGEGIVWATKTVVGRPRPDLANALIPAQGPSFPSGHAFVAFAFFGLVAWFAINHTTGSWKRLLLGFSAVIGIAALGFSRVYLGVHWLSDVLASFAAGAAWLTMLVTALAVAKAYGIQDTPRWANKTQRRVAVGLLSFVWAGVVLAYYETHPLIAQERPTPPRVDLQQGNFPATLFQQVPRFSEDIAGASMEPINVIVVGSESDLRTTIADAGWQATDPITMKSAGRLFFATLLDRDYPRAPGIPTFWHGKPNEFAFAQSTSRQSARERHHLHIWSTSFTVASRSVWLGTVHFDSLASTADRIPLFIHDIDPNVDRERETLRAELLATRCIGPISEATVTDPMLGRNAAGSPFFTDGNAIVVTLKCE
jgi:undecaprenyl-diphosphatase